MPTSFQVPSTGTLGDELLRPSNSRKTHARGRRWRRALSDATRRTVEVSFASALLLVAAPWLVVAIVYRACFGWPFVTVVRLGERRRKFQLVRLKLGNSIVDRVLRRFAIDRAFSLVQVLTGNLALVGPRAVAPDNEKMTQGSAGGRFRVRPGIVCLWWIRQRTNIAYGSELAADQQYVATRTLLGDAAILARAVIASVYGGATRETRESIRIFDLPVTNITMDTAITRMVEQVSAIQVGGTEPKQVCFINADCANLSFRNAEYRGVLQGAWMNLADGIGMKIAGRVFRQEIRENQCGTDVFLRLCEALAGTDKSLFLLGGKPGVAERVRDWMAERYPTTRVAGTQHGYFTSNEEPDVLKKVAASGASILLVAFGAPRQDTWTAQHLKATGAALAMGVGGLFDYYSGNVPRAPLWIREIGMEWAFRLCQEPKRLWRRYLCGNVAFLARVAWWRICGRGM